VPCCLENIAEGECAAATGTCRRAFRMYSSRGISVIGLQPLMLSAIDNKGILTKTRRTGNARKIQKLRRINPITEKSIFPGRHSRNTPVHRSARFFNMIWENSLRSQSVQEYILFIEYLDLYPWDSSISRHCRENSFGGRHDRGATTSFQICTRHSSSDTREDLPLTRPTSWPDKSRYA